MKHLIHGFATAFLLILSLPVQAQTIEAKPDGDAEAVRPDLGLINDVADVNAAIGKKWIGILCGQLEPAVRTHVEVADGVGLMVNEVLADSPAELVGLQEYDILVEADGHPLKSTADLVERVNAAGENGFQLTWLRKGKRKQVVIVPADRPASDFDNNSFTFRGGDEFDNLKKWLEKSQGDLEGERLRFRIFGPNTPPNGIQAQVLPEMPNNLSINVTRSGNEPAKITVQRVNDKWELTENDLDQLPDDVRPFVDNMLHGNVGMHVRGMNQQLPEHLEKIMEDMPWPRMNRQFEEIQQRMDRMFEELHELKELQPAGDAEESDDDTIDA